MERKLVLLVDDVKLNRMLLVRMLKDDYELLEAENGLVALDILKKHGAGISVVILDIGMPVMGGFEVLSEMRKDSVLSQIPVIVASSDTDSAAEAAALAAGAWDMIKKPYDAAVLKYRVQNVLNITENIKLRQEVAQLHEHDVMQRRLSAIIDNMSGAVGMTEFCKDGPKVFFRNQQFYKLLGADPGDAHPDPFTLTSDDEEQNQLFRGDFEQTLATGKPVERNLKLKNASGKDIYVRAVISRIPFDSLPNPVVMGLFEDITTEKERAEKERLANEKIRYYAEMDSLTGVFNRRKFCQAAHQLMISNPATDYVIVMSDIRGFKPLNELLGVTACNHMLIQIKDHLMEMVDSSCVFGRAGGDHFVICMPRNMLDLSMIERNAAPTYLDVSSYTVVRMRFGIYEVSDREMPVEIMFNRAQQASNSLVDDVLKTYAFYDDKVKSTTLLEQKLTSDMEKALSEHQFKVFLQPVVGNASGKVVGTEALVRWFHPSLGMISPGVFIPLFEQNGFIVNLDKYMFEETCRILAQWKEKGDDETYISVNLSRRSIFGSDMVNYISALANKYGINRRLLKIEITESVLARNQERIQSVLTQFHQEGFQVMMDDFGSMYSSLNSLKNLDVDVIKLDMKFIRDFDVSDKSGSILTAVMMMTRWIGLGTVAEGVETESQLSFLTSIGCDLIQGFYFAKPMPVVEFNDYRIKLEARMQENGNSSKQPIPVDIQELFGASPLLSKVFEGMGIGAAFFEYSPSRLVLLRANNEYLNYFGIKPDDAAATGGSIWEFMDDSLADREVKLINDAVKSGGTNTGYFETKRRDGSVCLVKRSVAFLCGNPSDAVILITVMDAFEGMESVLSRETTMRSVSGFIDPVKSGVAFIRVSDGELKFIYKNPAFLSSLGLEPGDDPVYYIVPEDRQALANLTCQAENEKHLGVDILIRCLRNGKVCKSSFTASYYGEENKGLSLILLSANPSFPIQTDDQSSVSEHSDYYSNIIEEASPVGIMMLRTLADGRFKPIFFDNRLPAVAGETVEGFRDALRAGTAISSFISEKYQEAFKRAFYDFVSTGDKMDFVFRPKVKDGSDCFMKINSDSFYGGGGNRIVILSFTDITREYSALSKASDTNRMLFQASRQAGLLSWIYDVRTGSADLSEYTAEFFSCKTLINDFVNFFSAGMVATEDVPAFKELHRKLQRGEPQASSVMCFLTNGMSRRHCCVARYVMLPQGSRAVFTAIPESNDSIIADNILKLASSKKQIAFVYNLEEKRVECLRTSEGAGVNKTVDAPLAIHPDYIKRLDELVTRAATGASVSLDYLANYESPGSGQWRWHRVKLIPMPNYDGVFDRIIGLDSDITDEKESIRLYAKRVSDLKVRSIHCFASLLVDLSGNLIVKAYGDSTIRALEGKTYDSLFDSSLGAVINAKSRDTLLGMKRTNLIDRFLSGETAFSSINQYSLGKKHLWLKSDMKLSRNPETGAISLLLETYDVTDSELSATVIDGITRQYYDFIIAVDPSNDSFAVIQNNGAIRDGITSFDSLITELSLKMEESSRQEFIEASKPQHLLESLKTEKYFGYSCLMDGKRNMFFTVFRIPGSPELVGLSMALDILYEEKH
ncbi:MAG: EAL domain-containing protein [Sphaerochaetaceae bacterium]